MAQIKCIIGERTGLKNVIDRVNIVAPRDIPVLLHGETGCGKEVIAQLIHQKSSRSKEVFHRVNCGAISQKLIDSELFGHEKGAFTGAIKMHKGWFEQADKGTLFLDEIAELPVDAQVRLLRVLQDGTFTRVGGEKEQTTDVRVVAATHRNLPEMIGQKLFRDDLYYRLSSFPMVIPSLRERRQDIEPLAKYYIAKASELFGIKPLSLNSADLEHLKAYSWPGNIREFISVVNRAVLLSEITGKLEIIQAIGINSEPQPSEPRQEIDKIEISRDETLAAITKIHIEKIINECHGRIEGSFGAARRLGLNPSTLRSKIKKLNINR
ncbi:sigma-54 interaction domain-containing protein [Reinekea marinisedimentorum]|uniref:Regulatory Fis family protein n=1 Tax=Reinekea marinisedimentorum TaxID=230495 RepID=A0A4R3HTE0_9GAMM|nr:sigma-54 dependent transcriptional regulator [Reinekea marinisedimentorum]TCS34792.1 regulatory Fis family protein [Reinekea marinisedimentorum]